VLVVKVYVYFVHVLVSVKIGPAIASIAEGDPPVPYLCESVIPKRFPVIDDLAQKDTVTFRPAPAR
jgi:hypothetical protein